MVPGGSSPLEAPPPSRDGDVLASGPLPGAVEFPDTAPLVDAMSHVETLLEVTPRRDCRGGPAHVCS